MYGSTNEVATHANGALSTLRIINATRSPQASISFHLKFAIDTPYAKITIFKSAVEKFIRARPREVGAVFVFVHGYMFFEALLSNSRFVL